MRSKNFAYNVELIQMLNRCVYGIVYSQIVYKALTPDNEVPLPENIQVYVNTTLAWDNIDRLDETLSGAGKGKWHCYPSQAFWCEPPSGPWNRAS